MKKVNLIKARKEKGLTQVEVAIKANISEASYQRIEYGQSEPNVQTAIRIADTLGIKSYKSFKNLFS